MSSIPYTLTPTVVSFTLNGHPHVVERTHPNYHLVKDALQNDRAADLEHLMSVHDAVKHYLSQGVNLAEVVDGVVYYDGEPVDDVISNRVLDLMTEGYDPQPMLRFLENLMENPSFNSREQLYRFLEHENLPLTEDGCFLAYKTVGSDLYSKRGGTLNLLQGKVNSSGQIFNGVGEVIECKRSEVDDNPQNHCSNGLHVGAWSYAGHGGWYNGCNDTVVVVKVNPKDAVSVPTDHDAQKLRVCKYTVVSTCEGKLVNSVATSDKPYEGTCKRFYKDDQVEFEYPNEDGEMEFRHGFVTENSFSDCKTVTLLLGEDDVSYTSRTDVLYRKFRKDEMVDVEFV